MAEIKIQMTGFQSIADRYFDGDLHLLIKTHQQSGNEIFRSEAEPLNVLVFRHDYFQQQVDFFRQSDLFHQIFYLMTHPDEALIREVVTDYSLNIPATGDSLIVGLTVAFLFNLMIHGIVYLTNAAFLRMHSGRTV